ncbi:hypothetical protein C1646_691640 [Rhizophagus diaphanus]|nr:hypothetical protein C1646_691640 [Rhizophagus diaphanus] [Rhizophagus sp. MUCL 43196]
MHVSSALLFRQTRCRFGAVVPMTVMTGLFRITFEHCCNISPSTLLLILWFSYIMSFVIVFVFIPLHIDILYIQYIQHSTLLCRSFVDHLLILSSSNFFFAYL